MVNNIILRNLDLSIMCEQRIAKCAYQDMKTYLLDASHDMKLEIPGLGFMKEWPYLSVERNYN